MTLKNTTDNTYVITHDLDPHSGLPGFPDRTIIRAFTPSVKIIPENLWDVRTQLDPLLLGGQLQVIEEDPYDPLVLRSTFGIPGFDGLAHLIPRWLDVQISVNQRIDDVEDTINELSLAVTVIPHKENHQITGSEITAREFTLEHTPTSVVLAFIQAGPTIIEGESFEIDGDIFRWSGYFLDGVLTTGEWVTLNYNRNP